MAKKSEINFVYFCPFHGTEVVPHVVFEKLKKGQEKRDVSWGMHCPRCFVQNGLIPINVGELFKKKERIVKKRGVSNKNG